MCLQEGQEAGSLQICLMGVENMKKGSNEGLEVTYTQTVF